MSTNKSGKNKKNEHSKIKCQLLYYFLPSEYKRTVKHGISGHDDRLICCKLS